MAKVAIKNENIPSFGGIYHVMDVFSKFGFEKLTETVVGKRGSSGNAYSYGSIFASLFFSYLCGGNVQSDMFGPLYAYRCILTNDRLSTEKDIIIFSELRYKNN